IPSTLPLTELSIRPLRPRLALIEPTGRKIIPPRCRWREDPCPDQGIPNPKPYAEAPRPPSHPPHRQNPAAHPRRQRIGLLSGVGFFLRQAALGQPSRRVSAA